jgi:uncharacterized phage protein gp47/JayE
MTFGVASTGFNLKLLAEILSDMEDSQRANIGASLNLGSDSVLGQVNGLYAAGLSELWEVAQAVYRAMDPDSAEGDALDIVCAIVGVRRLAASNSQVTLSLDLDAAITVPAGSIVSTDGNSDQRWRLLEDVTSTTAGAYNGLFECETTGPEDSGAGTIDVIETAVTGWNSVTHSAAVIVGRDRETDATLRARRVTSVQGVGTGTLGAIQASVGEVENVTSATAYENDTDATDADSVPPHAIEVVTLGGAAADIAQSIWDNKPAGIATYGTSSGTAVDTNGADQTVNYSPADDQQILIEVTLQKDPDTYVGDAAVATAIEDWAASRLTVGYNVIKSQISAAVAVLDGVMDVTLVRLSISPAALGTSNLTITRRQIATVDAGDVDVISTDWVET